MVKYCRKHFLECKYLLFSEGFGWYCPRCDRKLNDEELIELEPHDAKMNRDLLVKKETKIFVIALISFITMLLLASIVFNSIYNSPQAKMERRMDSFNELYELLVKYGNAGRSGSNAFIYIEDEKGNVWRQYNTLIDRCGLDSGYYEYADYIMDAEFVYEYIDTYSLEEFIAKLCYIFDNRDDRCSSSNEYCAARTINEMLLIALDYTSIEIKPFSMPAEGSKGYYTEHPEEVPKAETWEVSGAFYSSTGENKHRETRTCSTTVTVHGDFLVEHYSGYSYYEGAYEWRDGVFYNELPRWIGKSHDTVYYKGKAIHDNLDGAGLFYVGDTCYILYGPEECYAARHTCRNWKVLGQ